MSQLPISPAGPGARGSGLEDSDSEVLDTLQILRASDIVRQHLERGYYRNGDADSDSASSRDDDMVAEVGPPSATLPRAIEDQVGLQQQSLGGSILRWDPGFLKSCAPKPSQQRLVAPKSSADALASNNAVGGVPHAELACDKELLAILAETDPHYYPLRKRSEKNMHPYTKLVWTNPNDLYAPNGKRRDLSILEEPSGFDLRNTNAVNNSLRIDPDDSEDDEYIPGTLDEATNDTQNVEPDVEAGLLFPLVEHRQGLTYRHIAARRRQLQGRPPRKRPRSEGQTAGASMTSRRRRQRHSKQDDDEDHLLNISSVLGLRHSGSSGESSNDAVDDLSDPFGVPTSGDIHAKSLSATSPAVRRMRRASEGDGARNGTSVAHPGLPEPPSSPPIVSTGQSASRQLLSQSSEPYSGDAEASSPYSTAEPKRQRRLLPRSHFGSAGVGVTDQPTTKPVFTAELPVGVLPTSKARKLSKLSRNQIRGILPFSFMRDLSRDKNEAIQEEVDRWMHSGSRGSSKRRVLPSSPSEGSPERGNDRAMFDSGDDYAQVANDVSEMFSDLAIPSPRVDGATTVVSHRPLFSFNFIDIYEWQYPPLAPVGSVDRAPDFLRVAAREARRQGLRAKSAPDNPSRKAIFIHPRSVAEFEAEDIAQSILLSWNLGMIDLRRVFYCNECDNSDSEMEDYALVAERFGDGWPEINSSAVNTPELQSASIVLSDSDSEAAEDNSVSIMSLRRSHLGTSYKRRSRAAGSRVKRQSKLPGTSTGLMRGHILNKQAPGYSRRFVGRAQPAAHKLTSVMDEFAALDSDSDASYGTGNDNAGSPSARQRQPFTLDKGRQKNFRQFQRLPSTNKVFSNHNGTLTHALGRRKRRASLYSADGDTPLSTAVVEFLFDDEQASVASYWKQRSPKRLQTKLLLSGPASRPSPAPKASIGKLDAVASKIGKQQLKLVANPRSAPTKRQSRKSAPVRNLQPAVFPTRMQMRNTANSSIKTTVGASKAAKYTHGLDRMPMDDLSTSSPSGALIGDRDVDLPSLTSGARFGNGMWLSQGGLCRVQRMLYRTHQLGTGIHDSAADVPHAVDGERGGAYQYLDILRIDISATPAEFIQAYSTLFILWYEIVSGSIETNQAGSITDTETSVFQWTEYLQHFIASKATSKADLSRLAQRLTSCARDSIARLSRIAGKDKFDMGLAASIALSFSVSILQLALVFNSVSLARGSLGPQAVGEEEELDAQWSVDRFGAEIDDCLKVAVKLLLLDGLTHRQKEQRLGPAEQVWVAMIHLFPGPLSAPPASDASAVGWSAMGAVPVAGMWSAILQVCTSSAKSDRQLAGILWSAIVRLLPLTRLNSEGIAAPRSNRLCHKALLQLVEIATEKQLSGIERDSSDGQVRHLRPSEELGIRQTCFRIHSIVVNEGVGIGPGSPLYMTLYRYLESRRFCSLSIEPPPSLPRFFTRYSGVVDKVSEPSDTCTLLWLKALDRSLSEWVVQLKEVSPASKVHRRILRDVRSTVSKLLPTVILTFDQPTSGSHLSTLANYYSVFIFFLHAIPSDVVRSVRLYTQLQSMLRFKESSNLTARRVYFEAWSAAATIIALNLRKALEECGSDATRIIELLVAPDATATDTVIQASVKDYYNALKMAVGGWSESMSVVVAECTASNQRPIGGDMAPAAALWELADSAMMYLTRVLTSAALSDHTPTVLLLVLAALKSPPVLRLTTGSEFNAHTGMHLPLLKRLMAVLDAWRRAVAATTQADAKVDGAKSSVSGGKVAVATADSNNGGEDSQMDFAMFDSMDIMDIAAEAAELERRAPFAVIDAAILQVIHEQYTPGLRQAITRKFSSLSSRFLVEPSGQWHDLRALELTVGILAHMVSACVDAGLRTWESFLDEYGRDTLYLIPDSYGRRLVLVQFAVAAIDIARKRGQQTERLDVLLKDVWFASVCDLRLIVYVEQLTAQLAWADEKATALAVFTGALPILQLRRLVNQGQGTLWDSAMDGGATDVTRDAHQNAAPLAISIIGRVLKNMASSNGGEAGVHQQVFASWVARLLSTQQEMQAESRRRMHGVNDTRKLVDAMAARVVAL
ncbi:hypothetical protein IWW37_003947 [Coemansia sp. RSA 2050]|nr:hypothetical protein IWW37_003947 [Coemansia sp. RSA 2050]